ncbi:MAG: hypothetical protein HY695_00010 [Deltaproteobacteria bacterium]|nr:hypothetical protein [Deltaproteobacteria bacterium]
MALEVLTELFTGHMFELGNALSLTLKTGSEEPELPSLSIGINGDVMGGMKAPIEIGKKRVDIAYVNPSPIVTMAYMGKGFYKEKLPLRALASFPSWDRIAIVVSRDLKIKSLFDIVNKRIPLRISTRASGVHNTTYYTVSKILSLYGLSFAKIERWGGMIEECPHPGSPRRGESIEKREVDAVFDEGIRRKDGWLSKALENGYEVLNLEPKIIRTLARIGYQPAMIPKSRFKNLKDDATTIDFSGWPLITHRWLGENIAYAICEAIDARQSAIPVDDDLPLNMKSLCRDSENGPIKIPFHPGAIRYYKDKGYL